MLLEKRRSQFFITDNIEICSDVPDDPDDSDKKTEMKKIKYINLFSKETKIA